MRLLITGAAGFIGSNYVRGLVAGTIGDRIPFDQITILDKLTYAGRRETVADLISNFGVELVVGDISDPQLVDHTVRRHDVVVNFAAESHVDRSIASAEEFIRTNVLGTQVLLDAACRHGIERFVQVSTDEVYGSIDTGSWDEAQPVCPNSPYAASKAAADLLVLACHRTHGLDAVITRCSNNYGPYQFPEKLIPLFVTTLMAGGTVPLYGDGSNVRDWLHVSDHCRGIQLVLTGGSAGEVYNIGGGQELSNRELTGRLLEALGKNWDQVEHVADRPAHDRRYSVDHTKIANELGYAPTVSFDEGLKSTIAWYQNNERWWRPLIKQRAR